MDTWSKLVYVCLNVGLTTYCEYFKAYEESAYPASMRYRAVHCSIFSRITMDAILTEAVLTPVDPWILMAEGKI